MGEIFFSDRKPAYYWYENELLTNAIAYRILKRDSILKNLLVPVQMYFLSQKRKGEWNTYESSNVLASILPDLLAQGATKDSPATLKLSGKVNMTLNKFPYKVEMEPNETLLIEKQDGLPVYCIKYAKQWVTEAKTGVDGFRLKLPWERKIRICFTLESRFS